VSTEFGPCKDDSSLCVGKALANYVYEIQIPTTQPPASGKNNGSHGDDGCHGDNGCHGDDGKHVIVTMV